MICGTIGWGIGVGMGVCIGVGVIYSADMADAQYILMKLPWQKDKLLESFSGESPKKINDNLLTPASIERKNSHNSSNNSFLTPASIERKNSYNSSNNSVGERSLDDSLKSVKKKKDSIDHVKDDALDNSSNFPEKRAKDKKIKDKSPLGSIVAVKDKSPTEISPPLLINHPQRRQSISHTPSADFHFQNDKLFPKLKMDKDRNVIEGTQTSHSANNSAYFPIPENSLLNVSSRLQTDNLIDSFSSHQPQSSQTSPDPEGNSRSKRSPHNNEPVLLTRPLIELGTIPNYRAKKLKLKGGKNFPGTTSKKMKKSVSFSTHDVIPLSDGRKLVRKLNTHEPKKDETPYHKRGKNEYAVKKKIERENRRELRRLAKEKSECESSSNEDESEELENVLCYELDDIVPAPQTHDRKPYDYPHVIMFNGADYQKVLCGDVLATMYRPVVEKNVPEIRGLISFEGIYDLMSSSEKESHEIIVQTKYYLNNWTSKREYLAEKLDTPTLRAAIRSSISDPENKPVIENSVIPTAELKKLCISEIVKSVVAGFQFSINIHKYFLPDLYDMLKSLGMDINQQSFQLEAELRITVCVYKRLRSAEIVSQKAELDSTLILSTSYNVDIYVEKNPRAKNIQKSTE